MLSNVLDYRADHDDTVGPTVYDESEGWLLGLQLLAGCFGDRPVVPLGQKRIWYFTHRGVFLDPRFLVLSHRRLSVCWQSWPCLIV